MKEKEVKINKGTSGNVKKEEYIEEQVDYIYMCQWPTKDDCADRLLFFFFL